MNIGVRSKVKALFTKEEAVQIEAFLDRGFSANGEIFIASIFLMAKDRKSVQEVLAECEKEWVRNWQYQHPDIKGDAGAPGAAGAQNRLSLDNIYNTLQLSRPDNLRTSTVSSGAIIVKTKNSTYRFGEVNQRGERTVSRDEKPLDFSLCKIVYLEIGEGMELACFNSNHPAWYTTDVLSIR